MARVSKGPLPFQVTLMHQTQDTRYLLHSLYMMPVLHPRWKEVLLMGTPRRHRLLASVQLKTLIDGTISQLLISFSFFVYITTMTTGTQMAR